MTDEEVFGVPDINDVMRTQAARSDPYSAGNTGSRVLAGAIGGIPDLGIAGFNAGARLIGKAASQLPYVTPQLLENSGTAPLPQDAGTLRQLLEAGGSALVGGGAGGAARAASAAPTLAQAVVPTARSLATGVALPTVTSHYGGEAGGWLGGKLGDRETGALLGSLLGGAAPSAPRAAYSAIDARYRDQGRPGAPEIAAAAERQGVTPTAGMLGNPDIQLRERSLANRPGAMDYIADRRLTAQQQMRDALDRITTARGSTNAEPTPGTIGQGITDTAAAAATDLRVRSSEGQQRLADRMGNTEVPVQSVFESGYRQMPDLAMPARQAVDYRLTDQLAPLVSRDTAGQPILDRGSPTVPYDLLRQYRTDLGRSFDQGRYPPATTQLYGPVTDAMRSSAERQGVPMQDFENVQGRTRQVERRDGGDAAELTAIADREPGAAFNYMRGGEQNPDRLSMLEATQRPEVPGIMGDYLRLLGQQTLGQEGARGPINFANRIDNMHPEARDVIGGPQAPGVNDISTLARSFDYPTSQTGLGRTVGPIANAAARTITGSEIGGAIGHATGIPGASTVGRVIGAYAQAPLSNLRARMLQGETARNAMAGGARPEIGNVSDLIAALNASNTAAQQFGGPRRAVPR